MMVKEIDEELALFLKLRIGEQENESSGGHLIASSDEVDAPLGCNPLGSPISKAIAVPPARDEFLDSENDRTDFDWLLSPPRNTIFPSCKSEQNGVIMKNHDRPTALTSLDVENVDIEVVATKKTQVSHNAAAAAVKKKPSSSDPLTTTRRRASSTPRQPVLAAASTNKQPSRITWPCTKPMGPTTRPASRSSTPTVRSTTPKVVSAPPVRSSSASKTRSTVSKMTTLPQPCDPTKNLNPKKETRPVSASKVRANYSQSLVAEASSRRRASSGSSERCLSSGRTRRHSNGNDNGNGSSEDVNPVLMGTQMVERIVNMRKLARPDQGSYHQVTDAKFSSSIDKSSGFGRSLSKKSLDMAMRHMDISSSVNGNLRNVRFGSRKDHHKSDAESHVATSSNASSSSSGELVEDIGIGAVR